jgi:hypothetical protein
MLVTYIKVACLPRLGYCSIVRFTHILLRGAHEQAADEMSHNDLPGKLWHPTVDTVPANTGDTSDRLLHRLTTSLQRDDENPTGLADR